MAPGIDTHPGLTTLPGGVEGSLDLLTLAPLIGPSGDALLLEIGDYLLLEIGDFMLLE